MGGHSCRPPSVVVYKRQKL
ncbi:hypothetical protein KGM_211765 [Danaus plexippus plexippus]|uniref:Uncharacterized protein n=1 Tax=Danaus plexippus plexippus TaxID=278856 RepID=A0A212EW54_DANPL|nr:hypothetical protein KGM_211765 [Danaus plexippus plexippus]